MSKKKVPATQDDELFVRKTHLISESVKKTIEIHDFIKEIEDPYNQRLIRSPKFMLAGAVFSIDVIPDCTDFDDPGFIGVSLGNQSKEDHTALITLQKAIPPPSGVVVSTVGKVLAGKGSGWSNFLSHKEYQQWANAHGDVLKLEVVVTLYRKAEGDGWTRWCFYHAFPSRSNYNVQDQDPAGAQHPGDPLHRWEVHPGG